MNNKKGVKLLAAIMVFAMAFAGVIIISEESDAATIPEGAKNLGDNEFASGTIAKGVYKLTKDITVNNLVEISDGVTIYGNNFGITLGNDIYTYGTVTFNGVKFTVNTANMQVESYGQKIVLTDCTFEGDAKYAVYVENGTIEVTGTDFNGKKLTLTENAVLATIKSCSDLYLNLGIGAIFDPEDTTKDYVKVDLDSSTTVDSIRVSAGTTVNFKNQNIVTENFYIEGSSTATLVKNVTLTAENIAGYSGSGNKVKMEGVTLAGKTTIDSSIGITVPSEKKLTITGEVDGIEQITNNGTLVNNNAKPGSNLIAASGDASGEGWSFDSENKILTLNGYNGSNTFNGDITSVILIGDNTITLDADEKALIAIESTSVIADIKTEATGTGSLTIKIAGDNAGAAIKTSDGNVTINGVTITIDIENTKSSEADISAIDGVANNDLELKFANLMITVDDENDVSDGLAVKNLTLTKSTLIVSVPDKGVVVSTKTDVAGSTIAIDAGSLALKAGSSAAEISNESTIDLKTKTGYAFVGGFSASQGSSIDASSMDITVGTTNNATVINGGNMIIDAGVTFINKASFTNNGTMAVYGNLTNAGGETVNNGQINVYGYKAGTSIISGITFTDGEDSVKLNFKNITPLADGTFSVTVVIVKGDVDPEEPATEGGDEAGAEAQVIDPKDIQIEGILTVVNKTLTIKAVDSENSVNISVTYKDAIIGGEFSANAKENIEKYSVVVSDGSFKVTNKEVAVGTPGTNDASVDALRGLVSALVTPDDDAKQIITVTAGKLTNNGSMLINRAQAALVAGGELVNAGEISVKSNISTTSGKLSGNAIIVSENVTIDLTGTVDIVFTFAGEYTYTNTETEKEVTAAYDNQIKVVGGCKGVKFATSDIPDDEDGVVSIILMKNAPTTNKTVTITLVKGVFTNSGDNIFAKGVTVNVLADVLFQATGQITVGDGVLAVQDGATLNIKGDDPETYTYGKLVYKISFAKDGYTYYGSIAYALANASEGMTLILNDDGIISEDLTVGKGVTLQFAKGADLIISGEKKVTVTMLEGASFVFTDNNTIGVGTNGALVSGTFTYDINTVVLDKVLMNNSSTIGMTVAGKTAPSNITLTVGDKLVSGTVTAKTGKLVIDADFGADTTDNTASKLVVSKDSTVAEFAANALGLNAGASAVIDGTLVFAGDATVTSKVTGEGSISLLDGKNVGFDGTIAQNITVANEGATDKVVLIDMIANNEKATPATEYTVTITSVKASGTQAAYLDISGDYYSGTIQVNGNAGLSDLTVLEKAVLNIPAGSTVTVLVDSEVKGFVKVAGTINMKVAGDSTTVSYATLKYDITYTDGDYTVYTIVTTAISNATAGDSFTLTKDLEVADKLEVPSGVTIIVPEDYKIILGDNDYIILGSGITSIGATGGIQGTVQLTGSAYVLAYEDASMDNSKMKIVSSVTSEKIVDSQITVLNQLYATSYAIEDKANLSDVLKNVELEIDGYRFVKFTDVVGTTIPSDSTKKVGSTDVVADMLPSKVQVTFTKVDGITYYVNNVKQNTVGAPVYVNYGSTITAVADYGYDGTPLVNGKAYITVDNTTTTITGSGVSPASAPETSSDSGMGITDYLLIVLVVLAAILVVIVAIRMMRS